VAAAITAAKALFTDVKSDLTALFVSGSVSGTGDLEAQGQRFVASMKQVQAPAEMLIKDSTALLTGIDLYNDYKAGRTSVPTRGRGDALVFGPDWSPIQYAALNCALYQDSATSVVATAPANANYVGCFARYAVQGASEWVHAFAVTPTGADTFTYSSAARVATGSSSANVQVPAPVATGTVTTTRNGSGSVNSFQISGSLPGAFKQGTSSLVSYKHDWSVAGSRTPVAGSAPLSTVEFSATVVARDSANAILSTLKVTSGTLADLPVSRTASGKMVAPNHPLAVTSGGTQVATGSLQLVWTTPGAEFEGSFAATDSQWSKSLELHAPTKLVFQGALRNIDGAGNKTEFINGSASLTATGLANFDERLADSTSNYLSLDTSLTGTITVPSRPVLQLSLGASGKTYPNASKSATVQYRSIYGGAPRNSVDITGSKSAPGTGLVTLSEATSGLSIAISESAFTADLMLQNSTRIGVYDRRTQVMTFTDGSFMSLDLRN
jgi:hypothetical protein